MALRKPLVILNGIPQQLSASDTLDSGTSFNLSSGSKTIDVQADDGSGSIRIELRNPGGISYFDWDYDGSADYTARFALNSLTDFQFTGVAGLVYRYDRPVNFKGHVLFNNLWEVRQSTKPTTRPDGTTLVSGDRWYDTSDNFWYFWNGTYWLSEQIHRAITSYVGITGTTSLYAATINTNYNLFLLRSEISGQFASHDASNYFTVTLDQVSTSGGVTNELSYSSSNTTTTRVDTLNVFRDVSALAIGSFRYRFAKVGSTATPSVSPTCHLLYRLAKP